MKPRKIIYAVTIPQTANVFLKGQLKWFVDKGDDVVLVTSPGSELKVIAAREGCRFSMIHMEREISILRDSMAFARVLLLLFKEKPDVVNAGTPKAALLFMVASRLVRVKKRVYTLHGLRYQTARGVKRFVLKVGEKIACGCAQHVLCVSNSVRQALIRDGLAKASKAVVIQKGSCNGFETAAIDVAKLRIQHRAALMERHSINTGDFVIGFVGRFVKDKGIQELYAAYKEVRKELPNARLLLVGRFEDGDPLAGCVRKEIENDPAVVFTGFVDDVLPYYTLMSVYVLPSYREGLPYTPLEAASCAVPVITTRATGAVDSIIDHCTGILIDAVDVLQLRNALLMLARNSVLARQYGEQGREWVRQNFQPTAIWREIDAVYRA